MFVVIGFFLNLYVKVNKIINQMNFRPYLIQIITQTNSAGQLRLSTRSIPNLSLNFLLGMQYILIKNLDCYIKK